MIERLRTLVAELERTRGIAIDEQDFNDPAEPELLASARKDHGLSSQAVALWAAADGLTIEWTGEAGKEEVKGGIHIPPLETVLGDWHNAVYFDETPADDPKRRFHPFDDYDAGHGSGQFTGWFLDGSANPKVLFHDIELELHPLCNDLASYVELVLATRGALYWQQALLDVRRRKSPSGIFKKAVPKLFAGFDLKALK